MKLPQMEEIEELKESNREIVVMHEKMRWKLQNDQWRRSAATGVDGLEIQIAVLFVVGLEIQLEMVDDDKWSLRNLSE